jgi:DNA-directed RNA polymerase II subunit RPB11
MNAPDRMNAIIVPEGMPKIAMEPDAKVPNAALFKIAREDHTVGNLMRMELFRDPKVKFSGYKHPHPLENDIIVRIQTAPGAETPAAAFIGAASRLQREFKSMKTSFDAEIARLRQEQERL